MMLGKLVMGTALLVLIWGGGSAIAAAGDQAQCLGTTIPGQMAPSEVRTVTVTLKNTGTTTWTQFYLYNLVPVQTFDFGWTASTRVPMPVESVPAGGSVTFDFEIAAPAAVGDYTTYWQMEHYPDGKFGEICSAAVRVRPAATPTLTPTPPPVATSTPTRTPTPTVEGGGGTTLTVCPIGSTLAGCQYFGGDGIQQAVDAAPSGATVLIKNGDYPLSKHIMVGYSGHPPKQGIKIVGELGLVVLRDKALGLFDSQVEVRNLIIKDSDTIGIWVGGSSDVTISNNTISNNFNDGIYLIDHPQVIVQNNTIYGNHYAGVNAYNIGSDNDPAVIIKNNIIANNKKGSNGQWGPFGFGIGGFKWNGKKLENDTIAFNLIWANEKDNTSCGVNEVCSFPGKLVADPKFVNAAGGDFHLQAGSPACTGGENGTYMGAYPCTVMTVSAGYDQTNGDISDGGKPKVTVMAGDGKTLYYKYYVNGAWESTYHPVNMALGQVRSFDQTIAPYGPYPKQTAISVDGKSLYHRFFRNGVWDSTWANDPMTVQALPNGETAASWFDQTPFPNGHVSDGGKPKVTILSGDGKRLYYKYYQNGAWDTSWQTMAVANLGVGFDAIRSFDQTIAVSNNLPKQTVTTVDGKAIYYRSWTGSGWNGWTRLDIATQNIAADDTPLLPMLATNSKNGDFNADGFITLTDISLILQRYTALEIATNPELDKFDLNSDGKLNLTDVGLELAKYTALSVPV